MTLPDDILALANRFIEAIQAGDLESVKDCYHPKVEVWLNTTGVAVDREASLAVLSGFAARTSERRYEDRRLRLLTDGYVQQHVLRAVHIAGPVLTLPAVLVCKVRDGRIVRLEEYFDSAPLAVWRAQAAAAA
ncbi:nuclear transport factor 2 family protein [Brevundimonas naejangsanensis]|uniref:Nuclear transport factor 2 family protein n=1 Tax=Brevundimonas naejangsanensis TaxID=588932 RepID=A0A494RCQ8_9CAUL|nr:nuclear transport factor 2 family protein [Brevundimonas naejangsanensis]AYG93891.1 nuclear transport factor 2 family protein [Brevundimonas naejangsanensis]